MALGCGEAAQAEGTKQGTTQGAVAHAADAFGAAIGQETVGIYTETDVRGFNPQKAGNARLDGVYFDQLAPLSARTRSSYAIQVGLSAAGDAAPAPSGIVSYRARVPGSEPLLSVTASFLPYGGYSYEFDAEMPILGDRFGVGLGGAWANPNFADGADIRVNRVVAGLARIRLGDLEIKPFVSVLNTHRANTRPLITTSGPFLPPLPVDRDYLGQRWAENEIWNISHGVLAHAAITPSLSAHAGFVRSRILRERNFTEVFAVREPQGLARHRLLADPRQDSWADSWELFASWRVADGPLTQTVHANLRGRHRHIESGGAQAFDFGDVVLGVQDPEPEPAFAFGKLTIGSLDQVSYSAGYKAAWRELAQVNLGVTRSDYSAENRSPVGRSASSEAAWLYNASLVVRPARRLTLYAGYVSGLEDTGTAPENAANRNQQLPASRTSQLDAGLALSAGPLRVAATAFQMEKPYFSFDGAGRFVELADLRHRGIEVSAAGNLTGHLNLVAGVVLMDPRVTGAARTLGLVGPRPVGAPKLHAKLDAAWRVDALGGVRLTLAMQHDSRRAASTAGYAALGGNQLMIPARTTVDLGARHNFTVSGTPVSVRFVVSNVFDRRDWKLIAANSFQVDDARRYSLWIIADF